MKLFGHPLHAALVAFPLGLLLLVPLWDLGSSLLGAHEAAAVAYWSELAGLALGGVAAIAGLVDLTQLSNQSALPTALRHAGCALAALSLFGVAFVLRGHGDPLRPLVVVLDWLGAALLGATGWLGGHLVFRHGVGVQAAGPTPSAEEQREERDAHRRRQPI